MDEIAETGIVGSFTRYRLSGSSADSPLKMSIEVLLAALIPVLGGGMYGNQIRLCSQGLIDLIEQGRLANTPFPQETHATWLAGTPQDGKDFMHDLGAAQE
jgi:uncharacterized SAM-binding protein YcdF (DUF218 family)